MRHIFGRLANVGGARNGRWTAGWCAEIPVWSFIIQYSYQSAFLAPLFARWESFCHCLMCLCVVLNRLSCMRSRSHFRNGKGLHRGLNPMSFHARSSNVICLSTPLANQNKVNKCGLGKPKESLNKASGWGREADEGEGEPHSSPFPSGGPRQLGLHAALATLATLILATARRVARGV